MERTIKIIREKRLIAIVRGVRREDLLPFAEAVCRGGIAALELPFTAGKPETDAAAAENIALLSQAMQGEMVIGAGTVLTPAQVELTKQAGGRFIISPNTDPAVIGRTRALSMASIPGAMTPTEVAAAWALGADFVKLFPAGTLGSAYIKAIRAPLGHVSLLAVGGVSLENMSALREAGVCGFGIGGAIVNRDWIESRQFEKIEAAARAFSAAALG